MSVNVRTAPKSAATATTGIVSGSVISHRRRQKPAPSIAAASLMSFGIEMSPASMITAASGTIRHVCTATTDAIARLSRPSQYMLPSSRPSERSIQSIGL